MNKLYLNTVSISEKNKLHENKRKSAELEYLSNVTFLWSLLWRMTNCVHGRKKGRKGGRAVRMCRWMEGKRIGRKGL